MAHLLCPDDRSSDDRRSDDRSNDESISDDRRSEKRSSGKRVQWNVIHELSPKIIMVTFMKNVLSISTGWKGNLTVPTLKPSSDQDDRQTHIDSYEEEESIDDDGDDDDDNYDDDDDVTSLVEYFLPFGSLHWVCRNSRYSSWDWKVSIELSSLYALDSIDLSDVVVDDEDDKKDNDDTVDVDCDDVDDERILRCWLKYLLMTGNLYDKQHDNTYNNNNIAHDFNINTSTNKSNKCKLTKWMKI